MEPTALVVGAGYSPFRPMEPTALVVGLRTLNRTDGFSRRSNTDSLSDQGTDGFSRRSTILSELLPLPPAQ